MNYKPLRSYDSTEESPFAISGLELRKVVMKEGQQQLTNKETGEVGLWIPLTSDATVLTDTLEFRKVYENSFEELMDLSVPGFKVLIYIMRRLKKDKEMVRIELSDAMEYCKYQSKKMVYIGLVELIENKFIARANGEGNYHINTNFFFNGSRKKLKSNRLKDE